MTVSRTASLPWPQIPFVDCLDRPGRGKTKKIFAREYLSSGEFPVIDQGQGFIGGWTNDASAVIAEGLPYVIFGDHTRAFKYVPIPFALGADGTQLLKPRREFNPLFFYYACLHLRVPNRGYNRHFTVVKEMSLPRPPLGEQGRIAAALSLVQRAIEVEEKTLSTTRELKKTLLAQVFTQGLTRRGEQTTAFGPIPSNWSVYTIREKAALVAGGTPSRSEPAYWTNGTIPWVKTGEVNYRAIEDTDEKITPLALDRSAAKLLPKGTVLVAMYGQGVTRGKVAILGIEAATNQACVGLLLRDADILPEFLYYYLTFSYDRLRNLAHGAQQQNLNADLVGSFHFAAPRPDEQKEIVGALRTVDCSLANSEARLQSLRELFVYLLDTLMTGQIRVDTLAVDLSAAASH